MLKNLNIATKAGLVPLIPYWVFIAFLLVLLISFAEGRWALVPLYLITSFPFIFLYELFLAWLQQKDISIATSSSVMIAQMIIGGIINSLALFSLGYIPALYFNKNKIR
jgi:hypothetical protein